MNKYIEPDFKNSALITIDLQRDTLDGQPLEIAGTSAVLPRVREILDVFRLHRRPILHVVRIYRLDGSNVDNCRRDQFDRGNPILAEGTLGVELAEELFRPSSVRYETQRLLAGESQAIGDKELILYKPRWGAFFGTQLEAILRAEGITTTVFVGCNFPNCPRTSIYEASERDFKVVVAEDGISGLYEKGLDELKKIGVVVKTSEEIVAEFA
jgi:nicotinamidase-related amidase